jgi:predicted Ser/Thr protein kinase
VAKRGGSRHRLSDRFELKAQAGAGGMGTVYQAIDRRTAALTAVKILAVKSVADVGRFDQEALVLQELQHPGIVRYVDHGVTSHGDPYIAMEWLDGETLDQRLARGKLAPAGVAHLAARVLEALAAAHEHGVVHRDIKPSNVFLAGWRLFDPRIIDFGVARRVENPRRLTSRGATVGTPSYTAPEQARGEATVDGRADVFSLGCVLFECLTGRPPFSGPDAREVLAKVCLTPVPALEGRDQLDVELGRLIDSMLVQDRERRPGDARALAARFRHIAERLGASELPLSAGDPLVAPAPASPPQGLGFSEARLLCGLLLALDGRPVRPPPRPELGAWNGGGGGELPGRPIEVRRLTSAAGHLSEGREAPDPRDAVTLPLRKLAEPLGLALESFAEGAFILWPKAVLPLTDQIRRVVQAAGQLRGERPQARLAVAVGRAMVLAGSPVGPLGDRLMELLPDIPGTVRLDEDVARLTPSRLVARGEGGAWLRVEDRPDTGFAVVDPAEAPLVGRERELARLADTLRECIEQETARAVLIEGAPGMGKTRLGRALVQMCRQLRSPPRSVPGRRAGPQGPGPGSGETTAAFLLRGRPERSGEPFALLEPLLDPAARLGERAPAAARQAALVERLARLLDHQAVLLCCDDVHAADRASLELLNLALLELRQRPLLVVGLGRPEPFAGWNQLLEDNNPERWRLPALSRDAGQTLLRWWRQRAPDRDLDVNEYVFGRWQGSPFFLAELARAAAPRVMLAPDTVLGEIEPRLHCLDEEPRRVLRAASLLGDTFEFEGVLSLLGLKGRHALEETLEVLVEADLIRRLGDASGAYAFRQKLVREAAFAMLTPPDRRLGVARARQWLEEAGKTLPELLLELGGRRRRTSTSSVERPAVV